MPTSEEYKAYAVGGEGFIAPYRMAGFGVFPAGSIEDARGFILEKDLESSLFIIDEDILDGLSSAQELEDAGVNITILRGWGRSKMAGGKIRAASIKAIGTEIF